MDTVNFRLNQLFINPGRQISQGTTFRTLVFYEYFKYQYM
jgi:hypothetical protein